MFTQLNPMQNNLQVTLNQMLEIARYKILMPLDQRKLMNALIMDQMDQIKFNALSLEVKSLLMIQ